MTLTAITDHLLKDLRPLRFGPPVAYVYNPLKYAREPYDTYLKNYGNGQKEVVMVGMNPGPWGMAQTGIPFGEVEAVRRWLDIQGRVGQPHEMHPGRPVQGFSCPRSEVSGKRLWGWARKRFHTPENFFSRFFVANYCPMLFLEKSGRNLTPDKIRMAERKPLLEACDMALRRTVEALDPRYVVGVGRFAGKRAVLALSGCDVAIGHITHPSPANPKANMDWEARIEKELEALGVRISAMKARDESKG